MTAIEFEKLVDFAGLVTLSDWSSRFVIGLQVNTGYGTETFCEAVEYLPAEFAMLTRTRAEGQIEIIRRRLLKKATEKLRIAQ